MEVKEVKIDFDELSRTAGKTMLRLAREKAANAGSTIVYQDGDHLVEENPLTGEKIIFQYHTTES